MARAKREINERLPYAGAEFTYTPEQLKEIAKCKSDLLYFAENYFFIMNLDKNKKETINLHACQKKALKKMLDDRFVLLLASRQVGKSTMMSLVALWFAMFHADYSILLLANKESTAQEIFGRVRMAYELLPAWLKSPAVEYAKTSMKLENGSKISISTTTSDSARGMSINMLLIDEFAFVENDEDFYNSVFPIISSSQSSKIIISSTPNGTENKYYQLVQDAEEKKGIYTLVKIHWSEIPGRGKKWAEMMKAGMASEEAWLQEFELVFLNTGDSAINDELFVKMEKAAGPPKFILEGGNYRIWEEPREDRVYVAGVDIAEGVGENASVIQILDITDLGNVIQVAEYWNNTISPAMFVHPLHKILEHWGKPLALIERNNCGAQVIDSLYERYEYPYIVDWGIEKAASSAKRKTYQRMGVISHTNVKYAGVSNMRYWVNDIRAVTINSKECVMELKNFVRMPNGTWAGKPGKLDDRVMSLVWALQILDTLCCQGFFTILEYDAYNKPKRIEPAYLTYGFKEAIKNPLLEVTTFETGGKVVVDAPIIGRPTEGNAEMRKLKSEGWKLFETAEEKERNTKKSTKFFGFGSMR